MTETAKSYKAHLATEFATYAAVLYPPRLLVERR